MCTSAFIKKVAMTAALAVALSVAAHNKAKIQLSGIARKKNGFSYYNLLYF